MLTCAAFFPVVAPNATPAGIFEMYLAGIIISFVVERIARLVSPPGIESYGPPLLFP
jgi:hypothetical protein